MKRLDFYSEIFLWFGVWFGLVIRLYYYFRCTFDILFILVVRFLGLGSLFAHTSCTSAIKYYVIDIQRVYWLEIRPPKHTYLELWVYLLRILWFFRALACSLGFTSHIVWPPVDAGTIHHDGFHRLTANLIHWLTFDVTLGSAGTAPFPWTTYNDSLIVLLTNIYNTPLWLKDNLEHAANNPLSEDANRSELTFLPF